MATGFERKAAALVVETAVRTGQLTRVGAVDTNNHARVLEPAVAVVELASELALVDRLPR
jgi:hypothetical protein